MQTTTANVPSGQPVASNAVISPQFLASVDESPIWTSYASKSSLFLGVSHITIGILCILVNAVAIGAQSPIASTGHGIWGGSFFILTGVFGVLAGRHRTTCTIVTFVTLSLIAVGFFVIILLTLASVGISAHPEEERSLARSMDALMMALAILEAIVAIWSSANCCLSCCCGRRSLPSLVMRQTLATTSVPTAIVYTATTNYHRTGYTYPPQGTAAVVAAAGQPQQCSGPPTNQVPHSPITYPPQSAVTYPPQHTTAAPPQ